VNPLANDETWTDALGTTTRLEDMDPDHRANLIPFLRRNVIGLYLRYGGGTPVAGRNGLEDWLESTPLMRRLTAMEKGRTIEERQATAERNRAYEKATGYVKIGPG